MGIFIVRPCNKTVFIREGSKTKHFYHRRNECGWGYETALHLWAKEILAEARYVVLPALDYSGSLKWEISDVELEKKAGEIRPDVVITTARGKYAIEIAVTHFCDKAKIQKLNSLYDGAIEINLKGCSRLISKEDLAEILLEDIDCKEWLLNDQPGWSNVTYQQDDTTWLYRILGAGILGALIYWIYKTSQRYSSKEKQKMVALVKSKFK